jgi:hypothetical protein
VVLEAHDLGGSTVRVTTVVAPPLGGNHDRLLGK